MLESEIKFASYYVLAGAYAGHNGSERAILSHACALTAEGQADLDAARTLCKRVLIERMCTDDGQETGEPPTCPKCLEMLANRAKRFAKAKNA